MKKLPYLISTVAIFIIFFVVFDLQDQIQSHSQSSPQISSANNLEEMFDFLPAKGFISSAPITIPTESWTEIKSEPGLHVYKENVSWKNYLVIIDPLQNTITSRNKYMHMEDHWRQTRNPLCIVNAGFFESGGAPTLPIIEDSTIIKGEKTSKFPTRILYINEGWLSVSDITTNESVEASRWAMSGLNPSFYNRDNTVTNRTIIGVKDNNLYILVTQNRTVSKLVELMTIELDIPGENIIALDSGSSSQLRCFDQDYFASDRVVGSVIIVSRP